MATCKYCGKNGLFLKINNLSHCQQCADFIKDDIKNRVRIVEESLQTISLSKNEVTLKTRSKVLIDNLIFLMNEYQPLGLITTNPDPKTLLMLIIENENDQNIESLSKSPKLQVSVNWDLPLNPGGVEPETPEEINKLHLTNWKRAGVKSVRIYTARDNKVCEYCMSLHGKIISIDQAENGIPAHSCKSPNGCRCYYQPYIERSNN